MREKECEDKRERWEEEDIWEIFELEEDEKWLKKEEEREEEEREKKFDFDSTRAKKDKEKRRWLYDEHERWRSRLERWRKNFVNWLFALDVVEYFRQ